MVGIRSRCFNFGGFGRGFIGFVLVRGHIPKLFITVALIVVVLPRPKSVLGVLSVDVVGTLIVVDDAHLHTAVSEGVLVLVLLVVLGQHELVVHQSHNGLLSLWLRFIVFVGFCVRIHPWKQIQQHERTNDDRKETYDTELTKEVGNIHGDISPVVILAL